MLAVVIIWLYIILTTYSIGRGLCTLAGKCIGYRTDSLKAVLLCGLGGVIWYAQSFSIVYRVSLLSNILLILLCVFCIWISPKEVLADINRSLFFIRTKRVYVIVACVLFLLMAYGTSHGIIHYDTGLYHAQAIRWIEEYGIIPGLGNLHTRLAYNSAAFPLTALYSFAFLGIRSFHVTAGYCAFLLALECMDISAIWTRKQFTAAFFARAMAIYYLLMIFDEMISPASDYYMVCLAFILVIRWMDHIEAQDENASAYAMLAIFAGVILTIKLSGVLLLLIAILPGAMYIRQKNIKSIWLCVLAESVVVLPYLIRNIILSGYLLYPSTMFNVFRFDWKIPADIAVADYKEIQVYGRGYTEISGYERPITDWFGAWFSAQSFIDRMFILAAIGAVILFVIKCIYYGFIVSKGLKKRTSLNHLVMDGILCLCFMFWLFTSPLMRYGCLYVYLTAGVIWGRCVILITKNKYFKYVLYCGLSVVALYKVVMFGREAVSAYRPDTLLIQQDYDNFDVDTYEIDGIMIYAPQEGDRVGYSAFPSSPWEIDDIQLRGNSLLSGFKVKQ